MDPMIGGGSNIGGLRGASNMATSDASRGMK